MRELRIHRALDAANPMEAVMLRHPTLAWSSVTTNISRGKQSILLLCKGSRDALAALKREYVVRPPAQMEFIEVVRDSPAGLLLYEVERSGKDPTDISVWIGRELGPETVVKLSKSSAGVTWDLLTFHDERVPRFLARLKAAGGALEAKVHRRVPWYRVVRYAPGGFEAASVLDPAEEAVLRTALRMGYFESPKRCGVEDVALALGAPRSTVHHTLARAQRKAVGALLGE